MKSLNKILCGCAFATMAASLGVGLGVESEVASVKAADYTQHEAYFYKAEVQDTGCFYIYFAADGGDGVNAPAIENEALNAPIIAERLAEFNYLDKISFTIDGVETFLRDVKTADGAVFNKFTRWGCYGMNIDPTFAASFVAKKEGGKFENSLLTVYEGCELPTFAYGTGDSDTKESILTPVRAFNDVSRGGNVVQSFKIKGDIAIGSAYTSGNRTKSGCNFGPGHKNIDLTFQYNDYTGYDTTSNLTLNGLAAPLAAKEKIVLNGKPFDYYIEEAYKNSIGTDSLIQVVNNHYARPGCCAVDFNYLEDEITSFDVKKGMIIPQASAGGLYDYDWNTAQDNFADIKAKSNSEAYTVDRDYHFVQNGVTGFSDQDLTVFHEHNNVQLESARLLKWSDAGYMLSFTAKTPLNTYGEFKGIDGNFLSNYTFKNIELYAGDEKLDFTYGEQFFNLWKSGDFTTRVKHGEDTFGKLGEVTKIVVKAGLEFPDQDYCDVTAQPLNPGCEARKNAGCFYIENDVEFAKVGDTFIAINHREYDPDNTKEIVPQGIYVRPSNDVDSSMVFLQIRLPDDQINYAAAPANDEGAFYPENELANLNLLEKLHIIKIDGSEIDLKFEDLQSVRYNQWGDKDLFIQFNKEKLPLSELQTIREVVFDAGIEFPDYGTNVKLVSTSKHVYRYVNGSKYALDKQALGFWNATLYETQNRPFTEFSKVCLGEINVKPIGDGDAGLGSQRIWLQPEMDGDGKNIYSEINNNTNAVYSILFNTNMLGKIVLIKDGVETRMCDLYYGDDCCTINKWDRPKGTICIAPTLEQGFSYRNYDAIRLEAGLEIPAYGYQSTDGSELGYYVVPTTTTWYLNNQNGYGFQKTATFGETVLNTITGGKITNAPVVPTQEGHIGYWENESNALFDPNHIVADDEVYHAYQSELVTVTPTQIAGVRGDAGTSTNLTIKFDNADYGETTENVNVADFETFSSHLELYDVEGNQLPVNLNHERYIWKAGGTLLIQLLDSQSEFLHRIYKIVLKAGATAPSLSFMKTHEGSTYTIDKDYTYVRRPVTDTWELVTEPTEEISTKVTSFSVGINSLPANSYNVMLGLEGYVAGTQTQTAKIMLDVANKLHFFDEDGQEIAHLFNGEQYSSFGDKATVLFQILSDEAPAKIVLDEGMKIPSAEYVAGEGAMFVLSENAVAIKVGDAYQFVKEYTFDGESVYFAYGQAPDASKIPAPGTQESTDTIDYIGYWKDSEGNEFDPSAAVAKDMSFETAFKEEARKYNVNYVDEDGEAVKTVQVANGSEYEVEAGLTKTGYTGYWTSEDVTIDEDGKFTMPTSDVTLKAAYTANQYTLSFEGIDDELTVTYDSAIGNLPAVPSLDGKHALGWYIGEEKLEETTVWTFAEDKTAEAKYEDHSYTTWTDNGNGTHSSECKCGHVETENHVWGEGVVTTRPTHETTGVMTYTCTKCGATKTEVIPVLTDHDYTNNYVDNGNGLTHESYCICGEHITENHNWDEGVVTKAQSCTEDGVMTYTCADCGATKTEVIPANGHLWDQGVVTKEATCTEDGVMTYTCDTCHETKTEVIPATGHQLGELIAEVAATTEKEGMKAHYVCSVCGQYFDANKVACTKESLVIAKLPQPTPEPKKGCGGSVIAASAVVTGLAIAGAALIASKKKHD